MDTLNTGLLSGASSETLPLSQALSNRGQFSPWHSFSFSFRSSNYRTRTPYPELVSKYVITFLCLVLITYCLALRIHNCTNTLNTNYAVQQPT